MQFFHKAKSLFLNLCFPFRKKAAFERGISSVEFGTELTRLNQEFLRLDVELTMFDAEHRMYEHESLKEGFGKFTTESNSSSREKLERKIKLLRSRRPRRLDDDEGMGIPIR